MNSKNIDLIKRPIFLNSMARGGSNIIWQLFQSHPMVTSPLGETDKMFIREYGSLYSKKQIAMNLKSRHYPRFSFRKDRAKINFGLFNAQNYFERDLTFESANILNDHLRKWQMLTLKDDDNKYKSPTEIYTEEEIYETRLVAKHVNGMIYLTPALQKLYPDAVHFGLVRDGLALAESRLRRGTFKNIEKFAYFYLDTLKSFSRYANRYSNFHIVRFEDFLNQPSDFISSIYKLSGLEDDHENPIRLKIKSRMNASGEYVDSDRSNQKIWVERNSICEHVDPSINDNQIKLLSNHDKAKFLSIAGDEMRKLGYEY